MHPSVFGSQCVVRCVAARGVGNALALSVAYRHGRLTIGGGWCGTTGFDSRPIKHG